MLQLFRQFFVCVLSIFLVSGVAICQNIENKIDSLINCSYTISNSNPSQAFFVIDSALKLSEEVGYMKGKAGSLRIKGLTLFYGAKYAEALKLFLESEELYRHLGDTIGICNAKNLIAIVYDYQGLIEKSLEIDLENLSLRRLTGDTIGISMSLNNIAVSFSKLGRVGEALASYKEAIGLIDSMLNPSFLSRVINNIGIIYLNQGQSDSAYHYFTRSINIRQTINDRQGLANSYLSLGRYYQNLNNLEISRKHFEESFAIANEIGIVYEIESAAKELSNAYALLGQYKRAYEIGTIYKLMSDSLKSHETTQLLVQLEKEAQFEKEQEIRRIIQAKADLERQQKIEQQSHLRDILISLTLGILIVVILVSFEFKRKKRRNLDLLAQRKEITQQKEEILTQRDEIIIQLSVIETQRNRVALQKSLLETKNQKITDSIEYASSIQGALLPWTETLQKLVGEHFVLFKPKDIVSGDFYWVSDTPEGVLIAVGDCTGHGVAGALMSVLGISLLAEIVQKEKITRPNLILNRIRESLILSLHQSKSVSNNKDGMVMAICLLDKSNYSVQYSGASMAIAYTKRDGEVATLERLRPDRMPISIIPNMKDFTLHTFSLSKGDMLYFYSDGFADQVGGPHNKKFLLRPFLNLLQKNSKLDVERQKYELEQAIGTWMDFSENEFEQFDDITVIGIRM